MTDNTRVPQRAAAQSEPATSGRGTLRLVARILAIFFILQVPAAVLLHYSDFALPWVAVAMAGFVFTVGAVWQWTRATALAEMGTEQR